MQRISIYSVKVHYSSKVLISDKHPRVQRKSTYLAKSPKCNEYQLIYQDAHRLNKPAYEHLKTFSGSL